MRQQDIADAFGFAAKKSGLSQTYGTVQSVNADGSYQVRLNASAADARCAACCTAVAGDRVLVSILPSGQCAAVGRVGGEPGGASEPSDLGIEDYVVAEGTSGAWEYQKFASGRALVWGHMTPTATPYVTDWNGMNGYRTPDYAYPFQWVAEPACGYAGYIGSGFAINARFITTTQLCSFYFLSSSAGSQTVHVYCLMAGRWK